MFGWNSGKKERELRDLIQAVHAEVHSLRGDYNLLLRHVLRKEAEVANDLTKLKAAVAKLIAAVGNLPPDQTAELDGLADQISGVADQISPPPATPAP